MGRQILTDLEGPSGIIPDKELIDPFGINGLHHSHLRLRKLETIYHDRSNADNICMVRKGLCISFSYNEEGRRQIIDLAFPGDFLGLEALTYKAYISSASALTPSELAVYPVGDFIRQCYATPLLSRLLVECIAREHTLLAQRLTRITRRSATQRIAHLLLEVRGRAIRSVNSPSVAVIKNGRSLVAVTGNLQVKLPQTVIADILGISLVHVSRTMSKLKEEGLIEEASNGVLFCDLEGLKPLAQWEGVSP